MPRVTFDDSSVSAPQLQPKLVPLPVIHSPGPSAHLSVPSATERSALLSSSTSAPSLQVNNFDNDDNSEDYEDEDEIYYNDLEDPDHAHPLHRRHSHHRASHRSSSLYPLTWKQRLRRICSRFRLRHVVDRRPVWHVARIALGAAACMALNRAAQCTDDLSAVFNYFMCVSAFSGSTLLAVRETLVGGAVGAAFGVGAAALTAAASSGEQFYTMTWHAVWSVPLCMALLYYVLSVLGQQGPDKLQLLSAETSAILLIVAPFPYPPLAKVMQNNKWSLVVESLVTRAISLTNGCAVGLIMRAAGKGLQASQDWWERRQREKEEQNKAPDIFVDEDLEPSRRVSSLPSMSPLSRRRLHLDEAISFEVPVL